MIAVPDIDEILGADVVDVDGDRVGKVGQIYLDAADEHPSWVSVKTGLFGLSESLVPIDDATWDHSALHVSYGKARIKEAPRVDPDQDLSPEQQDRLYSYYEGGGSADDETVGSNGYGDSSATDATYAASGTPAYTGAEDALTGEAVTGIDVFAPAQSEAVATDAADDRPTATDDAVMTRSEERLTVGTETVETGRARLRKYIVTEQQTITVPVSHEEVRLEREPISAADFPPGTTVTEVGDAQTEVILTEERVVVQKETVPVERVRLTKETVTEERDITQAVRKEQIDLDGAGPGVGTESSSGASSSGASSLGAEPA